MKILIHGSGATLDLQKARKIKGHYRQLPNGKVVFIKEHFDKRQGKKEEYPKSKNKVIHADDKGTTYVDHEGKAKTYSHQSFREYDQDAIHDHLNSAMPIDEGLAFEMLKHKHDIGDFDAFLEKNLEDERKKEKPQFTTKAEAKRHFFDSKLQFQNSKHKKDWEEFERIGPEGWTADGEKDRAAPLKPEGFKGVKQYLKELQDKYGDVTTPAQAYLHEKHDDFRSYMHSVMDSEHHGDHHKAEAQMIIEHAHSAHAAAEAELKDIQAAQKLGPKDCPKIDGIDSSTQLFGHQAETLAKLNKLKRSIVDVDMGGGKGLILPADAMNLMGQGKVKKPLIVATGSTLEQNASKIIEYSGGKMNAFIISNQVIKDQFDGDLDKLVDAITQAPPNTIFMTTYDVLAYLGEDEREEKTFRRAQALSAAGFDYVACDESQKIKNVSSLRFRALRYLSKVKYKRVATGTFLSNNPLDTLGQLNFLYPHAAMNEKKFKETYGFKETPEGIEWTGLKDLRNDLTNMGMISLRRSAWIDKLPKRDENVSVAKMPPRMKAVYEAVLNDVLDALQQEASKNPRLRKFFEDDDIEDIEDMPPMALAKLGLVSGVTDYPHEMAEMMEEKLKTIKEAKNKGEIDEETQALIESLQALGSSTRSAIRSLTGMVSPKAEDAYKKIQEHFKDKKNGKFIVFCQRKASANHILNNMPPELKKMAMYYDASTPENLKAFQDTSPGTPQIIVAVDASIKEGVNLQMANGMYRYDHHWSPGDQEQSYARIWRFGQKRDTKIHLGVVDGGIDVPKLARMQTKLHQNMQVMSDFDEFSPPAFKMNLETLRSKNEASMLDEFMPLNAAILKYQMNENKELAQRFGKGMYKVATGKQIGGAKAKAMHGMGPYLSDLEGKELHAMDDKDADSLLGHFYDYHRKSGNSHFVYDNEVTDSFLGDIFNLYRRHELRGGGKKLDPFTIQQYVKEANDASPEAPLSDRAVKMMTEVVNNHLSGKKHTPHAKVDPRDAIKAMLKVNGWKENKSATEATLREAKMLEAFLDKNKADLTHLSNGKVENPEVADKFFAQLEKQYGEKIPLKSRKFLLGVVAMHREAKGGWGAIKYAYGHLAGHEEEGEGEE